MSRFRGPAATRSGNNAALGGWHARGRHPVTGGPMRFPWVLVGVVGCSSAASAPSGGVSTAPGAGSDTTATNDGSSDTAAPTSATVEPEFYGLELAFDVLDG